MIFFNDSFFDELFLLTNILKSVHYEKWFDDRTFSILSGMVRSLWEKRKGFLYAKIISESECKQNFFLRKTL